MKCKSIGFVPGLVVLVASVAQADQVVVSVEGAPPNQALTVGGPGLGVPPVQAKTDAMGKVQLLMQFGNQGKPLRLAVQEKKCEEGGQLNLIHAGAGQPAEGGCTERVGPTFVFDAAASPPGSVPQINIKYDSLTATVSQAPAVAQPAAPPKAVSRSVTTLITVSDAQHAKIMGAKITLVGLTPGLPAEAKILTTGESGATALMLLPGRYHWEVEAQGFSGSKGEITITPGQLRADLSVSLTAPPRDKELQALFEELFGPPGPLGTFDIGVGLAHRSSDNVKMTRSSDTVTDLRNGVPFSTRQNISSAEQQNGDFIFGETSGDGGIRAGAGLGQKTFGDWTLAAGGFVDLSRTNVTVKYKLRQPLVNFTSRSFDAVGVRVGADVETRLYRADRPWGLVLNVGVSRVKADDPVPTPGFAGEGVTEVEADGRIQVETFHVTTGTHYAVKNLAATLAYRYSSVDVTLGRSGTLQAGPFTRVISFESEFDQTSHQLVGGVDVRVWRHLWASLTGAVGGGSKSVGFGLRYVRGKK